MYIVSLVVVAFIVIFWTTDFDAVVVVVFVLVLLSLPLRLTLSLLWLTQK